MHPHIFLTAEKRENLRSQQEIRRAIQTGHTHDLWQRVLEQCAKEENLDPYIPSTPLPGRVEEHVKSQNTDYDLCKAVVDRILSASLASLLTGEPRYRNAAWTQILSILDESQWPDWRQIANRPKMPADLRTGMFGQALGLAYDWLYPALSQEQRTQLLTGLKRRAFDPFWESVEQNIWWVNGTNNWLTCIVGGLGIAAMAVGDDAQNKDLIAFSHERLTNYLTLYGPQGEFNESVGYAGSTIYPVTYFLADQYHTGGKTNRLSQSPFPHICRWLMYFTLPHNRYASFGDCVIDGPPQVNFFPAIAQATRDPILQWHYLQHSAPTERSTPYLELLWYDDTLEPQTNTLPTGRAYSAHGDCISSRTTWDPQNTPCVVYGKGGHGSELHGHHDAGQVCIDGYGERLIVDLGATKPTYPPGNIRYQFYNYHAEGHNILTFGGRDLRTGEQQQAHILNAHFDDTKGGYWTLDLTDLYEGATSVQRTVVHLKPAIVVILDTAHLINTEPISLRWHTIDSTKPDPDGRFVVHGKQATLEARTVCLSNTRPTYTQKEHTYAIPNYQTWLGEPFREQNESYIDIEQTANHCRLLTLFSIFGPEETPVPWQLDKGNWTIQTPEGKVQVNIQNDLTVQCGDLHWQVPVE